MLKDSAEEPVINILDSKMNLKNKIPQGVNSKSPSPARSPQMTLTPYSGERMRLQQQ